MSCELYVGNFPSSFTSEDLLTLFQDFEGIELLRFLKKVKKCYAFLRCCDQDQVIQVVMSMHDIDVCGRNLIVRSADESLQAAIQQLLNDGADTHSGSGGYSLDSKSYSTEPALGGYGMFHTSKRNVVYDQAATYSNIQSNGSFYNQSERNQTDLNLSLYSSPQKVYQDYSRPNDQFRYQMNNTRESTSCASNSMNNSDSKYAHRVNRSRYSFAHENSSESKYNNDDYSIGYYDEKLESADLNQDPSKDIYTKNDRESRSLPPLAVNPEISKDELFFVSVVNFPLGTPIRDLYDLFSDYNPFRILVICNVPRADKTPTEAIVSFISKKDATDAIINLDNTVYRKRVLLVTDAADLSLVPELLSFGWKDEEKYSSKSRSNQSYDRSSHTSYKNQQY